VSDRAAGCAFVVEQNGRHAQLGQVAIDEDAWKGRPYQPRQLLIRDAG
jgi:hypothetical protein